MSVIMELQENDPIVFIDDVVICEEGIPFQWEKAREFHVGEVVYFVDFYEDLSKPSDYNSWMVKFRTKEGKIFSAVQTFFVTQEQWETIEEYVIKKTNPDKSS